MKDKILIISYTFPPKSGVGGRRWAKFSKFFIKKGFDVTVISALPNADEKSSWNKDVENVKRHYIKPLIPDFSKVPSSLLQKVWTKINWTIIRIIAKSNPFDPTVFWKWRLIHKASKLIQKEGISKLIITGAPFKLLWIGTFLKDKFPHITYLADLRDPWGWENTYGFSLISNSQKEFEDTMLKRVVQLADIITVPVIPMKDKLESRFSNQKDKIKLLRHGFDEDDISPRIYPNSFDKLKLYYFGTLYEIDGIINSLIKAMKSNPNKIELNIYTAKNKYEDAFNDAGLKGQVIYHSRVEAKELFNILKSEASYAVLFKMDHRGKDNISTKYYEIIHARIPILLLGPSGAASKFVQENNLGLHFEVPEIEKGINQLCLNNHNFKYNYKFDTSKYALSDITDNLLQMMSNSERNEE